NGTTVDVVVHLNSGFAFANTGAADNQAFKFNAGAPVTLANITVDPHVPPLVAATGAFNGDGTGNFGFGINCPSCGGGLSSAFTTDIVFHVSNTTIANLTVANNLGNFFVADVGNITAGSPFNGNTGPIDAPGPPITTPEPSSVLTLGFAVLGLGLAMRRL